MIYSLSKWAALDLMHKRDAADQQTLDDNKNSKDTDNDDDDDDVEYIEIW